MKWKPWIMALLVFAGSCLLADWGLTHGLLQSPDSDSGRIRHLYLENGDELPVFGTSRVRGLDLGTNAFNYAMDGTSFEVTDVLLQIELAKPKTTPLVVELRFQDVDSLGDLGKLIPYVADPRFRQLFERFHALEWRYFVPGIRYFGYYDWFFKDYLIEQEHVIKVTRGFMEFLRPPPFDQGKFDELVQASRQMTNGYFPDEDQNRRLVAHITEHPQRLFFLVVPPCHPSRYVHFQNEPELKEFEARLAAFPNVVVIDWSRMYYPDPAFLDTFHLRREANADVSQKLRDKIKEVLRERTAPPAAGKIIHQ